MKESVARVSRFATSIRSGGSDPVLNDRGVISLLARARARSVLMRGGFGVEQDMPLARKLYQERDRCEG